MKQRTFTNLGYGCRKNLIKMLRMYLLQVLFILSDLGTEDAIYYSYAMRKRAGIDFRTESVSDGTTVSDDQMSVCNRKTASPGESLSQIDKG